MNIITNVDSFIQPPKSVTKTNSAEKLEDKKRYEEDARKKRDEGLRLMTEEKRRYMHTTSMIYMHNYYVNILYLGSEKRRS